MADDSEKDIDETWKEIKEVLNKTMEIKLPTKKSRSKPWISDETLSLHKLKKNCNDNKHKDFLSREIRRNLKNDEDIYMVDLTDQQDATCCRPREQ